MQEIYNTVIDLLDKLDVNDYTDQLISKLGEESHKKYPSGKTLIKAINFLGDDGKLPKTHAAKYIKHIDAVLEKQKKEKTKPKKAKDTKTQKTKKAKT
jgi:hypothetical protein